MVSLPPLIVVAGPTATGKTELGIRLGESLIAQGRPATVISADSRQVYRGLDIGTAKVTDADRQRVPHAGLDLVDPDERFAVSDFTTHVAGVLTDVAKADGVALLVGGTGLYLRAVARGLDLEALPDDPAVRARYGYDYYGFDRDGYNRNGNDPWGRNREENAAAGLDPYRFDADGHDIDGRRNY